MPELPEVETIAEGPAEALYCMKLSYMPRFSDRAALMLHRKSFLKNCKNGK